MVVLVTVLTAVQAVVALLVTPEVAACDPSLFENGTAINNRLALIATVKADTPAACCAACSSNPKCQLWTFHGSHPIGSQCKLRPDPPATRDAEAGAVSGVRAPPPTPAPPPPPFVPGSPNIIFLLTDGTKPSRSARPPLS
jgi:hypothetical protein